jgi:hypothetical protein
MNRLPPENKRSMFEDKYTRGAAHECWKWHKPAVTMTAFSWTEGSAPNRKNYALNLRRTALHYAGIEVPDKATVWNTCRNFGCCNPAHMDIQGNGPGRMKYMKTRRGGRPLKHDFTDEDLKYIWNNPDNMGAPAFGRYFDCHDQLINNIQNGWRFREEIERIFGPQVYWGKNRIRKYMDATKNSTRNSNDPNRNGSRV